MAMANTIKKKRHTLSFLIIGLLCVGLIGMFIFAHFQKGKNVENTTETDYHQVVYKGKNYKYNTSIVSILLMGIDTKDPTQVQGQADAIEMLLLDREKKTIKILTIPRDTMTEIRLFDVAGNDLGWHKHHLNLAYAYGQTPESGCMYMSQAISRLFKGIPMTRFAAVDLNMVTQVHEIVGDVKVVVPNDSLKDHNPQWKKGSTITITAHNVEEYLRTRDIDENFSNVPRMERQKAYLIEYFNVFKKKLENNFDNTVTKLYPILKEVSTNVTYSDMESFANMVLEYKFDATKDFYTLKGRDISGKLHDEFEIDQDSLEELLIELFYVEEELR